MGGIKKEKIFLMFSHNNINDNDKSTNLYKYI